MKIEQNLICYTSEMGHNNFLYPSNNKILLMKDCEAQKMSWIGGGNLFTPIRVKKSCLMPVDIYENTTSNISPPCKDEFTVVWIKKNA